MSTTDQQGQPGDQIGTPLDAGPFFHGTRVALEPGQELMPGFHSNYQPDVVMNHVYFTALVDGAGLAAEVVSLRGSEPHVYEVVPLGAFEDDPNVTDKKFPGNPTRSFRSTEPLRIVREITEWKRLRPEELALWRERLATIRDGEGGEILN